jgi:hypothetical protein
MFLIQRNFRLIHLIIIVISIVLWFIIAFGVNVILYTDFDFYDVSSVALALSLPVSYLLVYRFGLDY